MRAAGYDVRVAPDGTAGMAAALRAEHDAIVLHMRMPVMDGMAVLVELRRHAETAGTPVVVLSASVVEKVKVRALELGTRYFLEKPIDAPRLIEAVDAAPRVPAAPQAGGGCV